MLSPAIALSAGPHGVPVPPACSGFDRIPVYPPRSARPPTAPGPSRPDRDLPRHPPPKRPRPSSPPALACTCDSRHASGSRGLRQPRPPASSTRLVMSSPPSHPQRTASTVLPPSKSDRQHLRDEPTRPNLPVLTHTWRARHPITRSTPRRHSGRGTLLCQDSTSSETRVLTRRVYQPDLPIGRLANSSLGTGYVFLLGIVSPQRFPCRWSRGWEVQLNL